MLFLSLQPPIWPLCPTNVCEASSGLISHGGVQAKSSCNLLGTEALPRDFWSLPSVHTFKNPFLSIHIENNFAPALERSHTQDTRAVTVTSQKTFQVDDLENISPTSLSGPLLNMGCNISYSFGTAPGMLSRGSQ